MLLNCLSKFKLCVRGNGRRRSSKNKEESEIDHITSDITLIGSAGRMKVVCRKVEAIRSWRRFIIQMGENPLSHPVMKAGSS